MAGKRDRPTAPMRPAVKPLPKAICPHCRKPIEVMPSGLFALHAVRGKWSSSPCRGAGAAAVKPSRDPDR